MKHEAVITRSGIERSYGHRLFNGTRNPSRDTVLQIAFGFGLDCDGAQQLLKVAGMSPLHPKVKRDAVVAYCLHNGRSLMDAQELLYEYALPLLGGAKHE
ncbi:MAG: helix-turn-helix transcriptional regulator [Coriobacteriaceae bacterium]|nr:helix-turn-helix transcriptional regulator [Coriobacteriaceae bacterium]